MLAALRRDQHTAGFANRRQIRAIQKIFGNSNSFQQQHIVWVVDESSTSSNVRVRMARLILM